jgi:hypothetical protein
VLRAETNRLLDDPRSRDFVNAFLDYWLDLRTIFNNTPDQTLYVDYYLDDLLTESSLQETQMFVHYLLQRNLPARNIIQSNFTFLNSRLARLYSLPPVEGVALRKVALPTDSVRGGLLIQASVLRLTANGTTTSPVLRGVFILDRILGDPPPPPRQAYRRSTRIRVAPSLFASNWISIGRFSRARFVILRSILRGLHSRILMSWAPGGTSIVALTRVSP